METLVKEFPPGLAYKIIYDPDDLRRQIGRRGDQDDLRRDPAGGRRRVPVPAELARRDHSGDRDPGLAGRHLHLPLCARHFAEQSVAVRPRARGRHRRRRRHRRGGECRAQPRARHAAGRGRACHHGRGRRRADLDRADAVRGVRAVGVPVRHHRAILPAVRGHDRGLDADLLLRVADLEPGALRGAVQGA